MLVIRQILRRLPLLVLSLCLSAQTYFVAHAQTNPVPLRPAPAVAAELPPPFPDYAVAHDSLMRKVAAVRTRSDARQMRFIATQGTFGGLHRRIRSYGGLNMVLKKHTVKYRFGIALERVTYRDLLGRLLLSERYEGQQLTRLELSEYPERFKNPANAKWLLVRGDYLSYSTSSVSLAYKSKQREVKSKQREVYFFRALPAVQ